MAMIKKTDFTPALVLGNGVTVLGTARALRRSGIRAYCISRDLGFVRYSRYCRTFSSGKGRLTEDGDLRNYLQTLPIERAVLIPCSDHWLEEVAALNPQDGGHFVSSTPGLSVVRLLTDKQKFYEKLADLGIPHPFTAPIGNIEDLDTIDDHCFEHAFLKPTNSQKFFRTFRVKALKAGSRKKAREHYERVQSAGLSVMLQEFIPGPADQHYFIDGFIDRHGALKGSFARQRLRINPPDFGNSSFMRSVAAEDVRPARESLSELLDRIGYRGIFSAEFKKDPRDNVFKLLEVNARPWWYIEFAASCGVNVAKMAYQDALGVDVAPQMEYPTGIGCVYPYFDLDPCREAYRRGELTAREWLSSWVTSRQAVMSITDPLPTVAFCLWLARLKLKQILSR